MCTNNNIYKSLLQIRNRLFLLRSGTETAHQIYSDGEILHTLRECIVMLLCQNRRRHQIYHLFAFLHCFKCRTNGNFRLAIAHVTANQTIHDLRAFHIRLGVRNSRQLILGLLKWEHLFKFSLPYGIFAELIPFRLLTNSIQFHQILCHLIDCTAHLGLGAFPLLCAQLVQFRFLGIGRGIFLDHIKPCCQNVQIAAITVFYFHVILYDLIHLHFLNTAIDAQSVSLMHHIITHLQVVKVIYLLSLIKLFLLFFLLFRTENICLGQHDKFQPGILKALSHMAIIGKDFPCLYLAHGILRVYRRQLLIPQILRQTLGSCSGS